MRLSAEAQTCHLEATREPYLPGRSHPWVTCWAEAPREDFSIVSSLGWLLSPVDGRTSAEQNGEGPLLNENMDIHFLTGETSFPRPSSNSVAKLPAEGLCAVTAGPGEP